ncbi:MAG: CvpA family protein [Candidatus Omnitrophica bacterium]|nr:CvpA family protein [Candidatus Omnitrophota bacterium]
MEWIGEINWADALAIILILKTVFSGLQRGFFGELIYIGALYFSIIFSLHFYTQLANFLNSYLFVSNYVSGLIAFLLITVVTYVIIISLFNIIQNLKIIKIEAFSGLNRAGGAIFGFIKGIGIASILFLAMLLVPLKYVTESANKNSLLGPFFAQTGVMIYEKTLDVFAGIEARDLSGHLSGTAPIKLEKLRIKRRDKLDDILE